MPIQITCGSCQQKLSVPDDSGGKKTKCPKCSAIIDIPLAAAPQQPPSGGTDDLFGNLGATGGAPAQSNQDDLFAGVPTSTGGGGGAGGFGGGGHATGPMNPYAAPAPTSAMESMAGTGEPMSKGYIDIGGAMSSAWAIFGNNAGMLIVVLIVSFAINIGAQILSGICQAAGATIGGGDDTPEFFIGMAIGTFIAYIIQFYITIGSLRLHLATARGQGVEMGLLFSGGPYLLPYFGATILLILMTMGGLILLIIPGFIVMLTFWMFQYFLADRNVGVIESLKLSAEYSSGNRLSMLAIFLIMTLLSILALIPCGLGILVVGPWASLVIAVCYLQMTNQRVAA